MANYYNATEATLNFQASVDSKVSKPLLKFCLLSILGGAFIAFGGLLSVMVSGGMAGIGVLNPGLVKFMAGALFPVGLIMVSLAGVDLFTSDCAAFTMSRCSRIISTKTLLKYLILSYLFNFIGTQIVAVMLTYQVGLLQGSPWQEYLFAYAEGKVNQEFSTVLLKGIGANWLVCMGMFLGYSAKDVVGKCVGIWIPVMLFVTLGYEHSIANMFFIPTAIYIGADITWADFLINNLLPATIGNFVGGAALVGLTFWYLYIDKTK